MRLIQRAQICYDFSPYHIDDAVDYVLHLQELRTNLPNLLWMSFGNSNAPVQLSADGISLEVREPQPGLPDTEFTLWLNWSKALDAAAITGCNELIRNLRLYLPASLSIGLQLNLIAADQVVRELGTKLAATANPSRADTTTP